MKRMTLGFVGLMALAALTPTTASAGQRWDDGRGWDDRRGWNDRRGWDDRRDWRDDRRAWRDHRRYARNWNRGPRARTVCHWERGYYGPVRRCFRVHR